MMGNDDQKFYAIDDFSQFQGPKREVQSKVQRCGLSKKLNFIEGDCFEIFRTKFLGSRKVGVIFTTETILINRSIMPLEPLSSFWRTAH